MDAILAPQNVGNNIARILDESTVEVTRFPSVHSNYMLIDGVWHGKPRRLVFTGSHNFTGPALERNDETLLRLDDPMIYDAFFEDWERMFAHPLAER